MNQREIVPLQWAEESGGRFGDGISRPMPKARTRTHRLIVYPPGAQPMFWTIKAETKAHAMRYALARWPGAQVEVA